MKQFGVMSPTADQRVSILKWYVLVKPLNSTSWVLTAFLFPDKYSGNVFIWSVYSRLNDTLFK